MAITRSEGGKIVASWHQEDILGLLHHLGVSLAPGQASLLPWLSLASERRSTGE
jgi:hypothetical protein